MPTNSRIVHFFNFGTLILFVENLRLLLRLAKNNKSRCQPIQSMKNEKIFIPFLNVQNRQQRIIVKPTSSVNGEAWWFVNNEIILVILNDIYLEIQNWWLLSDCLMCEFVAIFYYVINSDLLAIYCYATLLNCLSVVCLVVGFELFY